MKLNNRIVAFCLALIMVNVAFWGDVQVFAHEAILDVVYDNCGYENKTGDETAVTIEDGIDEMWYVLNNSSSECWHISHEVNTIKYYFADSLEGSTYTWTTDISESVAQEIKNAYAESMKKWNNVYFYSYDNNGTLTKHKVINIVEGTETDHNLTIYPFTGNGSIASTWAVGTMNLIESDPISHSHRSEWRMKVNVRRFYINGNFNQEYVNLVRERTGAHELGHVLGLRDVDSENLCNASESESKSHHHEILMGYGDPITARCANITYKDIAGVAITRGFHTDNDHKWLNCGLQYDGTYKLICSICNGVKNVESLSEYTLPNLWSL